MCSHYEAPDPEHLFNVYGSIPGHKYKLDLWPGYTGPFLRQRLPERQDEDASQVEVTAGIYGLLPHWAKDTKLARRTYNARSETVAEKKSFRSAWAQGNHAIVLARAIYEPDWRSGIAVPTRITRRDCGLMGIAGLWDRWTGPDGEETLSFCMLTVNADQHSLMKLYHRPDDERRMVVILPNGCHQDWLKAKPEDSWDYMRQYPADRLQATPATSTSR